MMGVNNQNSTTDAESNSHIVLIEDFQIVPDVKKEAVSKSPKKTKKYVPHSYEREVARQSRRKAAGARQNRRDENTQFLLTLGDGDEMVEGDTGFLELVEPAVTAFDQLFLEQEKMKIWDSFMQQTEDEQERLLSGEWVPVQIPAADSDKADSEAMEKVIDERTVHPAFTPEQCYQQIDAGFRSFLKKKRVPWGSLEHLESEIIPFFEEWPSSVYLTQLQGPIDRLLLHALCQYLGLCSHSFNSDDGVRHTQVENRSDAFRSPSKKMSVFLRWKH